MSRGGEKATGQLPREIRYIVIHYHKGHQGDDALPLCHFHIESEGLLRQYLRLGEQGNHAPGFNRCSIGIYLEGTELKQIQYQVLQDLTDVLLKLFPDAEIVASKQLKAYNKL